VLFESRRGRVLGFLHENLRQLLRVRHRVLVPLAPLGDIAQELLIGGRADGHDDTVMFASHHLPHERLVLVGIGAAVREQDDVLRPRLDRFEGEVGLFERRENQRPAARLDRADLGPDEIAVLADVAEL